MAKLQQCVLLSTMMALGCGSRAPAVATFSAPAKLPETTFASSPAPASADSTVPAQRLLAESEVPAAQPEPEPAPESRPLRIAEPAPECTAVDWSARKLTPLLARSKGTTSDRGKGTTSARVARKGVREVLFDAECTDAPSGASRPTLASVVVEGVQIRMSSVSAAGSSGRKWAGNRCEFEVRLADGTGAPVVLSRQEVPPFNTIRAVVRSGSAAWLSIGFNGYTREFPNGGNRIVAVDLCRGRVIWQSKDGMSNDGLLLLDDYLIAPYGFTSEPRLVFVLDAYSGRVIQKLPVIENVCPSKAWAPHWQPGQRCDRPGQSVGAAEDPRIEDGVFVVDTNTGSSRFHFE